MHRGKHGGIQPGSLHGVRVQKEPEPEPDPADVHRAVLKQIKEMTPAQFIRFKRIAENVQKMNNAVEWRRSVIRDTF
jgi:hypothetical protein